MDRQQARIELESGASAYRERDFARAQRHFERSRDLHPAQPAIRLLIARAIHAQYRESAGSPGNAAKAREAIAAYREALASDPANEEGYQAVVTLYGAIGEEEAQRDWILLRAGDASVSANKRAEASLVLARKDSDCARAVTQNGPDTAYRCATRGLEFAEKALALDSENESAWSAKIQLLLTLAKLAGMEGNTQQQSRYEKQAVEAQSRAKEVMERARQKSEARSY